MGIKLSSEEKPCKIDLIVQVAHFTPSTFPMMPIVTLKSSSICKESWRKIISNEPSSEISQGVSGITKFYNEFYERLDAVDLGGEFDKILSSNTKGKNKIFAKGSLIIRIIDYILKIDGDSKELQDRLTKLGKAHVKLNIYPWQYSIFVEVLLLTISSLLREVASHEVIESWVNLFALVLKYMLPAALHGSNIKFDSVSPQYTIKSHLNPLVTKSFRHQELQIRKEDSKNKKKSNIKLNESKKGIPKRRPINDTLNSKSLHENRMKHINEMKDEEEKKRVIVLLPLMF